MTSTEPSAADSPEFAAFLTNMTHRLTAFVRDDLPDTVTVADGGEQPFLKDFSPGSLPWVEAFALTRLPGPGSVASPENQVFSENVMRYVGEVLLRSVGGSWDIDAPGGGGTGGAGNSGGGTGDGTGMPFIRPDSAAGESQGEPISVVSLLVTAAQQRNAEVFVRALAGAQAAFGPDGAPFRSCSAMSDEAGPAGGEAAGGRADGSVAPQPEEEFLATFLRTVEPAAAGWVRDQANPEEWTYDRASLERLGRQLRARFDDGAELATERDQLFIAGALRYVGETLRRASDGVWRYGAEGAADDPRTGQPYIRVTTMVDAEGSTRTADFVPWQLIRRAFTDEAALTAAFDRAVG